MPPLRPDNLEDGTVLLRSSLLERCGFRHAFSTAVGPEGTAFDLSPADGSPVETPKDRLARNLASFVAAVSPHGVLATARQVHGTSLVDARQAGTASADLVASHDPDVIAAVRTADCVPILLGCRRRGEVVAIHAGWRGLVADAPGIGVRHLLKAGSETEDLVAAIGPAIGLDRFEIGDEVAREFASSGLGEVLDHRSPRPHADLHAASVRRLAEAGLHREAIDGEPVCTSADARFFSHRRDGGRTGRHLAGITCWHPESTSGTL